MVGGGVFVVFLGGGGGGLRGCGEGEGMGWAWVSLGETFEQVEIEGVNLGSHDGDLMVVGTR